MLAAGAGVVSNGQPFTCGNRLPVPVFPEEQQKHLETQLFQAKKLYDSLPQDPEALIWYARRLGYMALYSEAIDVLTKGIDIHPEDARMYRHRGHRYLTIRCIEKAINDFEKAAVLVSGRPDEMEPDGQPNEANIPTSTLQSNIYYHLGLAYYLQKNYSKAQRAYEQCLMVSKNPDMYTATANWYYLTLQCLNEQEAAEKLLRNIDFNVPLLENGVYRKLLLLHKEKPSASQAMQIAHEGNDLQSATFLYGLYMYLKLNGFRNESESVRTKLLSGNQFSSFGYIAAEMDNPGQ